MFLNGLEGLEEACFHELRSSLGKLPVPANKPGSKISHAATLKGRYIPTMDGAQQIRFRAFIVLHTVEFRYYLLVCGMGVRAVQELNVCQMLSIWYAKTALSWIQPKGISLHACITCIYFVHTCTYLFILSTYVYIPWSYWYVLDYHIINSCVVVCRIPSLLSFLILTALRRFSKNCPLCWPSCMNPH